MRRFLSVVGAVAGLCLLAACGSTPPAAAPQQHTGIPASAPTPSSVPSAAPTSLTGPPPPPIHVDPKYLPSWMRGMADDPSDQTAKDEAAVGMLRVQSDLAQHGLGALQDLPYFPQRVVRQCAALNAGVADPAGEAVQSFSVPQRPLSRSDGARINAAISKDCA